MKVRRFFLLFFVVILLAACGADSDNENNNNGEEKESTTFRNIDIVTEDDDVKITGEMNSWDGNFYYHLLSGEEVIMDEEEVETEHIGFWSPFEIVLSKAEILELTDEVPHIVLHGKNSEGENINSNYVPIDLEENEAE